ncbi:MAG: dockerin type I repeat-containing protein [Candidatus Omnitrophica bacterium]|nr:dockerin type I repeat-containing protein [Candidatus Omnitrophota bacterium]
MISKRSLIYFCAIICVAVIFCFWASRVEADTLSFSVDKMGVNSLSYGDTIFITPKAGGGGSPTAYLLQDVAFLNSAGQLTACMGTSSVIISKTLCDVTSQTLDADGQGTLTKYSWGQIHQRFSGVANQLKIQVTVENNASDPIDSLSLNVINVKLPSPPLESDGWTPLLIRAPGDPGILSLTTTSRKVVLVDEDMVKPLTIGFPWAADRPNQKPAIPVCVNFPVYLMIGNPHPFTVDWGNNRSIPAHGTDSFDISLRFGKATDSIHALTGDIEDKFVSQYPFHLNWPDRRPIGADMMAAGTTGSSETNPRGWFNKPNADYVSASGRQAFRTELLARVDTEITVLKSLNAQGIILWDLEGEEFRNLTYLGDPRVIDRGLSGNESVAPEMDAVIDEVFAKFKAAGFKVGMTIRPQAFSAGTRLPDGCNDMDVFIKTDAPFNQKLHICQGTQWVQTTFSKGADLPATCINAQLYYKTSAPAETYLCQNSSWIVASTRVHQQYTTDYAQELIKKIAYAKNRWGATLFYVDSYGSGYSNYHNMRPYNFQGLKTVAEAFPDVLLIPETASAAYFSVSLPYLEPVNWNPPYCGTRKDVMALYPSAGSAIYIHKVTDPVARKDELAASVSRGDLIIVNSWYDGSMTVNTKDVYAAAALNPVPGDITGNKRVSLYDAAITLRGGLTPEQQVQADLNNDTTVDAKDARMIARRALGL